MDRYAVLTPSTFVTRILRFTVVAFLVGCAERQPEIRLELTDTVGLYGREYSRIPVRVVADNGASPAPPYDLTPSDKSILGVSGAFVRCLRDGSTRVHVTAAGVSSSFTAQCRLATRIAVESYLTFEPGSPPISLTGIATFADGDTATVFPVAAISNDTSVAVTRGRSVAPAGIGYAGLRVDWGGTTARMGVEVRQTIFDGVLELPRGESRRWPLPAGRYVISVKVNDRDDLNRLNMETEGLNCSRDSRDGDTIHCVAAGPALVTVLHRTMTSAGSARAFVRLRRVK